MRDSPQFRSEDFPEHDTNWLHSAWRSKVRSRLLDWFALHRREMPWRANPEPYRVWVSEVMLQQTQVATVIPYFERFLVRYPSIKALADTDEASLMSLWEGLGYYRRARMLHAAAKQIVEKHDGIFPSDYDEVLALPGIGRYTAGAILSISQNQRLPILEGNTQRVFSRWIASRGKIGEKQAMSLLWQVSEAMLPKLGKDSTRGPSSFNQAAMELGALVCTPRSPNCSECPIEKSCAAKRLGLQESIPGKVTKTVYESRIEYAFVIRNAQKDCFLMRPIAEGERWSGLWDFPRITRGDVENPQIAASLFGDSIGSSAMLGQSLASFKHAVTKYRITLDVFEATIDKKWKAAAPWKYVNASEMDALPLSVTGRKIAKLIFRLYL